MTMSPTRTPTHPVVGVDQRVRAAAAYRQHNQLQLRQKVQRPGRAVLGGRVVTDTEAEQTVDTVGAPRVRDAVNDARTMRIAHRHRPIVAHVHGHRLLLGMMLATANRAERIRKTIGTQRRHRRRLAARFDFDEQQQIRFDEALAKRHELGVRLVGVQLRHDRPEHRIERIQLMDEFLAWQWNNVVC